MVLPYLDWLAQLSFDKGEQSQKVTDVRSLVEKFLIKKFAIDGKVKLTPKNVAVLSKIISEYSVESENIREIS